MTPEEFEQDQVYQDMLCELNALHFHVVPMLEDKNEMLSNALQEIIALICYQAPLDEQDKWLANMIELGLYTLDEEE